MLIALDIAFLVAIAVACWRGYQGRRMWMPLLTQMLYRLLHGKGFWGQLLRFAPLAIIWLMLCHRVNNLGWHATAAGGILIAMTIGLDAMRRFEEQQKTERSSCEK